MPEGHALSVIVAQLTNSERFACRMASLQASQRDLAGQNEALEAVTRQLRSALVNKAEELQGVRQNMDQIHKMLRYACVFLNPRV